MSRNLILSISLLFVFYTSIHETKAQQIPDSICTEIGKYLTEFTNRDVSVSNIKIESANINKKTIRLIANVNLSYISFTDKDVDNIYENIKSFLPEKYKKYKIELISDTKKIEDLVLFSGSKGLFAIRVR